MPDLSVNRTLVKSPPELWSELSEVESLARHLGEFGEITISRLDPEHTVAWEGEHARGTVELEAAGWGTKVTLSAALPEPETVEEAPEPVAEAPPEPEPEPEAPAPAPVAKRESWLRRWFFRQRHVDPEPEPEPAEPEDAQADPEPLAWYDPDPGCPPEPAPAPWDAQAEPDAEAEEPAVDADRARAVLEETLDTLGAAHHRPFSREG